MIILLSMSLSYFQLIQFNRRVLIFQQGMKQKSKSWRQLRSQPLTIGNNQTGLSSALSYHSRLMFPQVGDSQFYYDSGKKHFNNQSDRLLKIILPQKYALEKSLIQRQRSIPMPHLQPQVSIQREKLYSQNSITTSKNQIQKQEQHLKINSVINDQLDRMKGLFDKKTFLQEQKTRIASKLSLSNPVNETISPVHSYSVKDEKKSYLLYNPQNKQKYDKLDQGRKLNPTHLSTGLSII